MREIICSEITKDQPAYLPAEWSDPVAAGTSGPENILEAGLRNLSMSPHLRYCNDLFDEEAD